MPPLAGRAGGGKRVGRGGRGLVELRLVERGRIDPTLLTTHRFRFDEMLKAFEMMDKKLDGIITQEDIREVVLQGKDARETRVSEIMTRGVYYANPGMTIDTCVLLMASRRLRHLPVLDGSRVISMISVEDILERVTHESES